MIGELFNNPDKQFQISDDDDAKLFLLELGLLGKFSNVSTSRTQIITYADLPTHFIVALFFTGKTKQTDNGYLVHCLPKSKYPPALAMRFVESITKRHDYIESAKPLGENSEDS